MRVLDTVLALVFCLFQAVLILVVVFALVGSRWIEEIESTNDAGYFQRVLSMDEFAVFDVGSEVRYIGLYRIYVEESTSYPLPIRDAEVDMACTGFILSIIIGFIGLFCVSFQLFGLYTEIAWLDLTIMWTTFLQMVLNITSTSIAVYYFKQTFRRFERFGMASFLGWISVAIAAILFIVTVMRVLLTLKEQKSKKKQKGSNAERYATTSMSAHGTARSYAGRDTGSRSDLRPAPVAGAYASAPRSQQGSRNDLTSEGAPRFNTASPPRSYHDSPAQGSPRNNRYYDEQDAPRFAQR
jgi:hypothetical protein